MLTLPMCNDITKSQPVTVPEHVRAPGYTSKIFHGRTTENFNVFIYCFDLTNDSQFAQFTIFCVSRLQPCRYELQ